MKKTEDAYRDYLVQKELADSTIRIYMNVVNCFEKFRKGRRIEKSMIIGYKEDMRKRGYAVSSMNLHIIVLNKFLSFCKLEDCRVKPLKVQRRQSIENVITDEEYKALLHLAQSSGRQKYYFIMRTLALTGIRVSELQYVTVEALEKGYTRVNNKGKYREIYLPDSLSADLREYCGSQGITEGIVFRGNTSSPISREAVWRMLKRLAELAGIDKSRVYPHSFRHYFALKYMKEFSDIFELADILGHSNLETTRIYLSTSIENKRSRMERLDT